MSWTGKLVRVDLGTGGWVLETKDGRVALFGEIDDGLAEQRVVVHGTELDGVSCLMVGDRMVQVERVVKA
ncbi:MAG: hypothetical protein ABMA64_04610 [Myxococcota bacterium]